MSWGRMSVAIRLTNSENFSEERAASMMDLQLSVGYDFHSVRYSGTPGWSPVFVLNVVDADSVRENAQSSD